mmetsp:Transcript_52627/g.94724  ORF Transcript_52627/g.94724 Transcript_52627/m.94724 type:complete len:241 (+) Transcript_52627:694-1416(+)
MVYHRDLTQALLPPDDEVAQLPTAEERSSMRKNPLLKLGTELFQSCCLVSDCGRGQLRLPTKELDSLGRTLHSILQFAEAKERLEVLGIVPLMREVFPDLGSCIGKVGEASHVVILVIFILGSGCPLGRIFEPARGLSLCHLGRAGGGCRGASCSALGALGRRGRRRVSSHLGAGLWLRLPPGVLLGCSLRCLVALHEATAHGPGFCPHIFCQCVGSPHANMLPDGIYEASSHQQQLQQQ